MTERNRELRIEAFEFRPINRDDAAEIVGWRYGGADVVYNLAAGDRASLLIPEREHFVAHDDGGAVLGFCCFGTDARVPGVAYPYGPAAIVDLGVGLRPDLVGRGIGPRCIRAAMALGERRFGARQFRATVAAWNERALRAAEIAGFRESARPHRDWDASEWVILLTDAHA